MHVKLSRQISTMKNLKRRSDLSGVRAKSSPQKKTTDKRPSKMTPSLPRLKRDQLPEPLRFALLPLPFLAVFSILSRETYKGSAAGGLGMIPARRFRGETCAP